MATLAGHGWRRCRFSPDFRHEVVNVETVARFSRLLRRERAGEAACSRHSRDKEATPSRRMRDKPRRRRGNAATIPPGEATGTPRECHPVDKSIKERPLHAAQRCLRYFPTLEGGRFRPTHCRSGYNKRGLIADVVGSAELRLPLTPPLATKRVRTLAEPTAIHNRSNHFYAITRRSRRDAKNNLRLGVHDAHLSHVAVKSGIGDDNLVPQY